jgi:hypothetical protein
MFASGWGDGCYASYWGYDNENQVSCLLTDFNLFAHPALVIAGRSQWRGWLPAKWFSRRKR